MANFGAGIGQAFEGLFRLAGCALVFGGVMALVAAAAVAWACVR